DDFKKDDFINQPGKISLQNIVKLRDAIKLLMSAPGDKSTINKFIDQVTTKAIKIIKDISFAESNVSDLTALFTFFDEEKTKGCNVFTVARQKMLNATKKRVSNFMDPDKAIQFIEGMLKAG